MVKHTAVFLDRDGTINRDVPYCSRPEDFEFLPTAPQAIKLLNGCGLKVVVITNQSGIARGYFTEETLSHIHHKMQQELAKEGAIIDAYHCPHHPNDQCQCRKPQPTLLLRAAIEMNLDVAHSFVIGDKLEDIRMGKKVGCETILVSSRSKLKETDLEDLTPSYIAPNLYQAAIWVSERIAKGVRRDANPNHRSYRFCRQPSSRLYS